MTLLSWNLSSSYCFDSLIFRFFFSLVCISWTAGLLATNHHNVCFCFSKMPLYHCHFSRTVVGVQFLIAGFDLSALLVMSYYCFLACIIFGGEVSNQKITFFWPLLRFFFFFHGFFFWCAMNMYPSLYFSFLRLTEFIDIYFDLSSFEIVIFIFSNIISVSFSSCSYWESNYMFTMLHVYFKFFLYLPRIYYSVL